MSVPKPGSPAVKKGAINRSVPKKTKDEKPKQLIFICTYFKVDERVEVEIKAESDISAVEIFHKKYGGFPSEVKKKPYSPKPNLTHRPFANIKSEFYGKGNK